MKNRVLQPVIKIAIIYFILIVTFIKVPNLFAHSDHNETFNEYPNVSFTGYHTHNQDGVYHRHAVPPTGAFNGLHDKLGQWEKHEHASPTQQYGTYLLTIQYVNSTPTELPNGSVGSYLVTYARNSDKAFVNEIVNALFSREINLDSELHYDTEMNTANFQYFGQYISGLSPPDEKVSGQGTSTKTKMLSLRWAELKAM